jgi:acetoin utilization deacetylase AcuC-like enzyme
MIANRRAIRNRKSSIVNFLLVTRHCCMKVVYSDEYDLHLGAHVFPSAKYRLTKEKLVQEGIIREADLLTPSPASDEDIGLVHDRTYILKLKNGTLSAEEILRLEVPYSPELVRAVWLAAGGSILAGKLVLEERLAVNLTGGFHHAYPDHGEGFCLIHDVAVAIRRLQKDREIGRAMTIDCDVHQGNGTAAIFCNDPSVFTFSIHQERNYPYPKPPSDLDVGLEDGASDHEYLAALEQGLVQSLARFQPDLIFYLAGADPYSQDQLGGLKLSQQGLIDRDRLVFESAVRRSIPVVVTLAGGYARHLGDTVRIHANTIRVAKEFVAPRGAFRNL